MTNVINGRMNWNTNDEKEICDINQKQPMNENLVTSLSSGISIFHTIYARLCSALCCYGNIMISFHYSDVMMGTMASQITRLTVVYSTVYSGRSKKISKLCVTGIWAGNSPVTGEFPAQRSSNAENVSLWWCHHAVKHVKLKKKLTEFVNIKCVIREVGAKWHS